MKIKIIAVGKIKESYLKIGIDEYLKRIKPYCDMEIVELNDFSVFDNLNESEITKAKNKEGNEILKVIKSNDFVINLDLNQQEFDSVSLSEFIEKSLTKGGSKIVFVIGGSYGLSDDVKKRANESISLSKLTFLHQMTRLILLEQIYRSFKILNKETYHK